MSLYTQILKLLNKNDTTSYSSQVLNDQFQNEPLIYIEKVLRLLEADKMVLKESIELQRKNELVYTISSEGRHFLYNRRSNRTFILISILNTIISITAIIISILSF